MLTRALALLSLTALVACSPSPATHDAHDAHHGSHHAHDGAHHAAPASSGSASVDDALSRVAAIHGGHGPWAVAGYRMGRFAIGKLGLSPQSFDLEVTHHSPREVQFSCIADGASAATGASVGKLNLSMVEASEPETRTVYRRKSTGQSITLRVNKAFVERFKGVPREQLAQAGRTVLALRDDEIFEEVRLHFRPHIER